MSEFQLQPGPRCFVNAATGEQGRMFYERIPATTKDGSQYASVINAGYAVTYNPCTGKGHITLTVRHKKDEFSKKHALSACLYRLNKGEYIPFTLSCSTGGIVTTNEVFYIVSAYLEDMSEGARLLENSTLTLTIDGSNAKVSELIRIRADHRFKAFTKLFKLVDSVTRNLASLGLEAVQ